VAGIRISFIRLFRGGGGGSLPQQDAALREEIYVTMPAEFAIVCIEWPLSRVCGMFLKRVDLSGGRRLGVGERLKRTKVGGGVIKLKRDESGQVGRRKTPALFRFASVLDLFSARERRPHARRHFLRHSLARVSRAARISCLFQPVRMARPDGGAEVIVIHEKYTGRAEMKPARRIDRAAASPARGCGIFLFTPAMERAGRDNLDKRLEKHRPRGTIRAISN